MKYITFLFLFLLFACNANEEKRTTQKENNELKWLLTGLPDDHTNENIVAKLYGFQFVDVGGCIVSNQLRDSIRRENEQLNKLLSIKFGKSWRVNFDKRVAYVAEKINRSLR